MTKPPSIARFELLYWASVILGFVYAALDWNATQAKLSATPVLADATWLLPFIQVVSLAVAITIWFFIARRPSIVAKWVQVVFAGFQVLGILYVLFVLASGGAAVTIPVVLGLVSNILYVAAAVLLFKPDARLWFGEGLDDDDLEAPVA